MARVGLRLPAGGFPRRGWGFAALAAVCLVLRAPHLSGPLDLRFDAGVYYTLGMSLAEGKGYRMLSEPGEPHGVLFPPLLPALAAAHQLAMGTSDPDTVGHALRWTYFVMFTAYILAVFWMASAYLTGGYAFVAALIVAFHFNTNRLADYFIAELPFGLAATLFFGLIGPGETSRVPTGKQSSDLDVPDWAACPRSFLAPVSGSHAAGGLGSRASSAASIWANRDSDRARRQRDPRLARLHRLGEEGDRSMPRPPMPISTRPTIITTFRTPTASC